MNILITKNMFIAMATIITIQLIAIVYLVAFKVGPPTLNEHPSQAVNEKPVNVPNSKTQQDLQVSFQLEANQLLEEHKIAITKKPELHTPTAEQILIQQEAAMNVSSLFDNALAVGEWTKNDTDDFMKHRRNLSSEDLALLHLRFHAAFNTQELNIRHFPPL